jgi:DNA-binding response OmpR family regulator
VTDGARLLIVEDERNLAQGMRFNFELEGYAVEVVGDGNLALERLGRGEPPVDLVILDVMLPGRDGFEVARELRELRDHTPILMLTAKSLPEDVVHGLEAGADDYLPKPFDLAVLLARVKGLLRRRDWAKSGERESVAVGAAEVDFRTFELRRDGQTYRLTVLEAMLLKLLVQNPDRVVSKAEILEKVWNLSPDTETRAVDNFIVRLRRYVEPDPAVPRHILTVRGAGYRCVKGEA